MEASRADGAIRRARFAVPAPAKGDRSAERVRLVDPTGCAVAWLDCGEILMVRAFLIRSDAGAWQELARDREVEVPGTDRSGTWGLVERDPTMARLQWHSGERSRPVGIVAGVEDGRLTIATNDAVVVLSIA